MYFFFRFISIMIDLGMIFYWSFRTLLTFFFFCTVIDEFDVDYITYCYGLNMLALRGKKILDIFFHCKIDEKHSRECLNQYTCDRIRKNCKHNELESMTRSKLCSCVDRVKELWNVSNEIIDEINTVFLKTNSRSHTSGWSFFLVYMLTSDFMILRSAYIIYM